MKAREQWQKRIGWKKGGSVSSTPGKLRYQKRYNATEEAKNRRVQMNKARREAIREGRARVGDDTNVDHIRSLDDGGTNAPGNLRIVREGKNKGWRKGTSSYSPKKGKFNR